MRIAEIDALEREASRHLAGHIPAAIGLRHSIHRSPCLGGEETETRSLIEAALGVTGVPVAEGMYVRVGPASGPSVAVRAELDALPIQEKSGRAWSSERPGAAHLCGHDVHAAALAAAAMTLRELEIPIGFVAAYQPREEVMPSGARDFVASDEFRGNEIQAMLGLHLQPALPSGHISSIPGPVNASADDFEIRIAGRAAHGAYPHRGNDPIVAAAAIVQAVQQLVSRRIDPMTPAVVTIGRLRAGDSNNQIPGEATLGGTVRSYHEGDRGFLQAELGQVARSVAGAYGCEAEVVFSQGEPVLHNDPELTASIAAALEDDGAVQAEPFRSCGSDDFAFYCEIFPSLMIFVGVGDGHADSPGLHNPAFAPDDDLVEVLARMMLRAYFAVVRNNPQLMFDQKELHA
ncbi:M20 family metallopeptidase [Pseudoclavibacter sp. RFBA6]|uniref:M20 metallopeptidase family protein n=1 Tax=Pseudoclavibacter sp. RFBA6 TaxID=2080573 RepID=UPI0015E1EEC4|nr:M20 family metallopeptidase [Pseudoclavibacter sp. RFBA6]